MNLSLVFFSSSFFPVGEKKKKIKHFSLCVYSIAQSYYFLLKEKEKISLKSIIRDWLRGD
jgi:hypothetical protein